MPCIMQLFKFTVIKNINNIKLDTKININNAKDNLASLSFLIVKFHTIKLRKM